MFNFKTEIVTQNYSVFVTTETWLDDNISDADLYIGGYNNFRKDRIGRGGGIMLYGTCTMSCNRRKLVPRF